ncbi:MAG: elongation factor P [Candidatus Kapabacteria bacterium]|nr:elongation factor P [Candidatus Kapabacteria bacterium]
MGSATDLKKGAVVKYNGENCVVIETQHIKPGKGGAFFQTKMRNIRTGKVVENRFRSEETVEFVRVERRSYQYLYKDGSDLIFMDVNTFEQIGIPDDTLGSEIRFLKENEIALLAFEGEAVLSVDVPQHVNLRVIHTEPGFKGDTATNVTKPATLETGAEIGVPIFINEGDLIRVDTREASYIERVKE